MAFLFFIENRISKTMRFSVIFLVNITNCIIIRVFPISGIKRLFQGICRAKTVENAYLLLKIAKKEVIRFIAYPIIATYAFKKGPKHRHNIRKCDNKGKNSYYFFLKIPFITIYIDIIPIYFRCSKKSRHQIFALVYEKMNVIFYSEKLGFGVRGAKGCS